MRGVTYSTSQRKCPTLFQLTRLMRGVTSCARRLRHRIHQFQLTRLMRGVTALQLFTVAPFKFQLTRLMRGVTITVI